MELPVEVNQTGGPPYINSGSKTFRHPKICYFISGILHP